MRKNIEVMLQTTSRKKKKKSHNQNKTKKKHKQRKTKTSVLSSAWKKKFRIGSSSSKATYCTRETSIHCLFNLETVPKAGFKAITSKVPPCCRNIVAFSIGLTKPAFLNKHDFIWQRSSPLFAQQSWDTLYIEEQAAAQAWEFLPSTFTASCKYILFRCNIRNCSLTACW